MKTSAKEDLIQGRPQPRKTSALEEPKFWKTSAF